MSWDVRPSWAGGEHRRGDCLAARDSRNPPGESIQAALRGQAGGACAVLVPRVLCLVAAPLLHLCLVAAPLLHLCGADPLHHLCNCNQCSEPGAAGRHSRPTGQGTQCRGRRAGVTGQGSQGRSHRAGVTGQGSQGTLRETRDIMMSEGASRTKAILRECHVVIPTTLHLCHCFFRNLCRRGSPLRYGLFCRSMESA